MDWDACFDCSFVFLGAPLLYGVVVVLVRTWRRFPKARQLRRWRAGLCTECGYDLTGNQSARCPECGKRVIR